MTPRTIHQLFINPHDGSGDGIPDLVNQQRATWIAHHPAYDYRLWTQADILRLCRARDAAAVADAIEIARFPATKADIARLWLVVEFGGFWIDLRLAAKLPFLDDLRAYPVVIAEHFPKEQLEEPNGFLINSFLGAPARSPFFTRCLSVATQNVVNRVPGPIYRNAGPGVLMQVRDEMPGVIHMLPHAQTWSVLFDKGHAPYNAGGLHWSLREEAGESPYIHGLSEGALSSGAISG